MTEQFDVHEITEIETNHSGLSDYSPKITIKTEDEYITFVVRKDKIRRGDSVLVETDDIITREKI